MCDSCVEKLSRVSSAVFWSPTITSILLVDKGACPSQVPCQVCHKAANVRPNIIGGVHTIDNYTNGAFHRFGSFQGTVGSGDDVVTIDSEFRASIFDALFGKSTTVQPASVCLLPCIKS